MRFLYDKGFTDRTSFFGVISYSHTDSSSHLGFICMEAVLIPL